VIDIQAIKKEFDVCPFMNISAGNVGQSRNSLAEKKKMRPWSVNRAGVVGWRRCFLARRCLTKLKIKILAEPVAAGKNAVQLRHARTEKLVGRNKHTI